MERKKVIPIFSIAVAVAIIIAGMMFIMPGDDGPVIVVSAAPGDPEIDALTVITGIQIFTTGDALVGNITTHGGSVNMRVGHDVTKMTVWFALNSTLYDEVVGIVPGIDNFTDMVRISITVTDPATPTPGETAFGHASVTTLAYHSQNATAKIGYATFDSTHENLPLTLDLSGTWDIDILYEIYIFSE